MNQPDPSDQLRAMAVENVRRRMRRTRPLFWLIAHICLSMVALTVIYYNFHIPLFWENFEGGGQGHTDFFFQFTFLWAGLIALHAFAVLGWYMWSYAVWRETQHLARTVSADAAITTAQPLTKPKRMRLADDGELADTQDDYESVPLSSKHDSHETH